MVASQLLVNLSLALEGWNGCRLSETYDRCAMAMESCRV